MNLVVIGGGKVGFQLAKKLNAKGHGVTVVEIDPNRCERLAEMLEGPTIVCGDGDEPDILDEANLRNASAVIAATGDDEDNLVVCLLGKLEYSVPLTIARINNPANEWLFGERYGVDVAVSQADVIMSVVEKELSLGDIVTMLKLQGEGLVVDELTLAAGSPAVGKRIMDLGLPSCAQVLAIIGTDGSVEVPSGATELAVGDELLILAKCGEESALQRAFGVSSA